MYATKVYDRDSQNKYIHIYIYINIYILCECSLSALIRSGSDESLAGQILSVQLSGSGKPRTWAG